MKSCCERVLSAGLNPETCNHMVAREMQGTPRLELRRSPINRARVHPYLGTVDEAVKRRGVTFDAGSVEGLNRILAQIAKGSSLQSSQSITGG